MKQVDELIRGELSAVKSIDAILGRIKDEKEKSELYSIRQDHFVAVDKLSRFVGTNVRRDMESSKTTSGPWGSFASAFTGGASFFGDKAALKALKVGEEHGLKEYREAMNETRIDPELKRVIQSDLLPVQERHIKTIERYLQ